MTNRLYEFNMNKEDGLPQAKIVWENTLETTIYNGDILFIFDEYDDLTRIDGNIYCDHVDADFQSSEISIILDKDLLNNESLKKSVRFVNFEDIEEDTETNIEEDIKDIKRKIMPSTKYIPMQMPEVKLNCEKCDRFAGGKINLSFSKNIRTKTV